MLGRVKERRSLSYITDSSLSSEGEGATGCGVESEKKVMGDSKFASGSSPCGWLR